MASWGLKLRNYRSDHSYRSLRCTFATRPISEADVDVSWEGISNAACHEESQCEVLVEITMRSYCSHMHRQRPKRSDEDR